MSGVTKLGAKLIGFSGSYLRFEGIATIEKIEDGKVVESASETNAVWELMYFGKAGKDKEYKQKNKRGSASFFKYIS